MLKFVDFSNFSSFNAQIHGISAVLYFPYTVSLMSLFELYGMSVPIFTPGLEYAVALDMQGSGMSFRYGYPSEIWPPSGYGAPTAPSPLNLSYASVKHWLNLSDFARLPHIQHFEDSDDDLMQQLCAADFDRISRDMASTNAEFLAHAEAFWLAFFSRVRADPASRIK